jgi:hypothetical protein
MPVILGVTANGENVYDRPRSHLHGDVAALLPEVLGRLSICIRAGDVFESDVDLGRVVGETVCVEVGPDDLVVSEFRPGRRGVSRVVYGREPEPCQHVTVVVMRSREAGNNLVLLTAYVGRYLGPEPGDPRSTPESRSRWANMALIVK